MDKTMQTSFDVSVFNVSKMRADANKIAKDMGFRNDGEIDAFRHAYTSAKMRETYGEAIANATGHAHEIGRDIFGNNPINDRNMDIHNNEMGRIIESEIASRGIIDDEKEKLLREEIAKSVRNRELQTDPNIPPRPRQNHDQKIPSEPADIRVGLSNDPAPTIVTGGSGGGEVFVHSYSRRTGDVQSHTRSRPDDNVGNNFGARGGSSKSGSSAGIREPGPNETRIPGVLHFKQ